MSLLLSTAEKKGNTALPMVLHQYNMSGKEIQGESNWNDFWLKIRICFLEEN